MEEYEYPIDEQLGRIKNWDVIRQSPKELIKYVKSLWWAPDWGFKLYTGRDKLFNTPVVKLELHTGGWSGNESIIEALQSTGFWWLFWEKSTRGGHYWFSIPRDRWIKESDAD